MSVSCVKIEVESSPAIQVTLCTSSIGQYATECFHTPLRNWRTIWY